MNSLEFIKQHVTEWPYSLLGEMNRVQLIGNGTVVFDSPSQPPYHSVDLSEHFAPDYYDGKVWTREEFESVEYRFNSDLPNALLKREGGDYYYFVRIESEWVKYTDTTLRAHWSDAVEINELMANNYIKQGVPINESQPPVGTFEQPDAHWDNAPEWATSLGKNKVNLVWYNSIRYQYVDGLNDYEFGLDGNSALNDVTHIMDRPMTNEPSVDATVEERGSRYGAFKDGADIMQSLKTVMRDTPNWSSLTPSQREALEMIQHKIGRILNGDPNYTDSWHDIQGYARLVEEELNGNVK